MTELLKDRIAIVTGGAKGLGRAVARGLDEAGATVVVSDINEAGAQATADELNNGVGAGCDVRDENQVTDLIDWVSSRYGRLDVMIANAGIATVSPITEMPLEEWRSVLAVNLDGVFTSVRHAGRAMLANGGGSIITMASITGFAGSPLISHYAAAKAGVISLTRTAAVELRDHGVRVNAICPGWISTDLVHERRYQFEDALGIDFESMINSKQGRLGEVEDVAPLAVFLASERSRFASGSTFVVDGGMSAALV
ncbi:NAD(P)-dependent dehydrogenase, short-chain alcohol dehydrogenase family [Haloechinothrix alba]|uniref:NAD(P)-dependent dehydrogenase, short-chain alcohol dehydrogenase family n=1 Tax=Haloechinothrix alba TaxID=664784 RepID=A0A238ZKZ9_9PSEU|nr:SDR family NAD(P)-dependent oxidoreductase [Haloechinothrix alba]SNR83990.1 NAD(P)-dependent dehydrogenase, short-chain alcohol dehydrogenase family [Haloechinothrix alba]